MTGHKVALQLSPCPLSCSKLASLPEEGTRFSSGLCLVYVVQLVKPAHSNVLSAIILLGHGT